MSKDTFYKKESTFESSSSSGLSSGMSSTGLASGTSGLSSGMGTNMCPPGTKPAFASTTVCHTAPVVEHIDRPAVIKEKIRREEVEEIQPVIHRERERLEVHQMVQPIYEGVTENVRIQEKQLPAQFLPGRSAPGYVAAPLEKGGIEYSKEHHMKVDRPALVEEIERKRIIEEVQPVIYKEVVQPSILRETQPIYEKIVEPYTVTKEVLPPVYRSSGTASQYETGKFATGMASTSGFSSGMTSGFGSESCTTTYGTTCVPATGMASTSSTSSGLASTAGRAIEKLGEKLQQKTSLSDPKKKEVITTTTTTTGPEVLLDPNHPHCHYPENKLGAKHLETSAHGEKFEKGSSGGQVYAARKV